MIFIAGKSINRPLSGNGFTLLEVMISSVILTVSLLGVAGGAVPVTCWCMIYN